MNRSRFFLTFTAVAMTVLVALVLWADGAGRRWRGEDLPRLRQLVTRLGLTDVALWTEARYTRHPSQTDLFSAFQDFPGSPEHFPAGSIVPPPPALSDPDDVVAPKSVGRGRDDEGEHRRRDVGATRDPSADQREAGRRDVGAPKDQGDVVGPAPPPTISARPTAGDEPP